MSWLDVLASIPTNAVLRQKLKTLQEEFEAMEARISELEDENKQLRENVSADAGPLNDIEISILEFVARAGDYVPENQFAGELGIPPAKAEHYLRSLVDNEYLDMALNMFDGASYNLSQKASGFLIDTGRL